MDAVIIGIGVIALVVGIWYGAIGLGLLIMHVQEQHTHLNVVRKRGVSAVLPPLGR